MENEYRAFTGFRCWTEAETDQAVEWAQPDLDSLENGEWQRRFDELAVEPELIRLELEHYQRKDGLRRTARYIAGCALFMCGVAGVTYGVSNYESQAVSRKTVAAYQAVNSLDQQVQAAGFGPLKQAAPADISKYPTINVANTAMLLKDNIAFAGLKIPGCTIKNVVISYTTGNDSSQVTGITQFSAYLKSGLGAVQFTDLKQLEQLTAHRPCEQLYATP